MLLYGLFVESDPPHSILMILSAEAITRLLQQSEREAILDRATPTLSVMKHLGAEWTWDVISPAAYEARLDAITVSGMTQALVNAESDEREAVGNRERAVEVVHRETVRVLTVARVAWREVPERWVLVAPLGAVGQTTRAILDEGEEWETVWAETEPGWVPIAGLTLASFQGLLAAVPGALREERRMRVRRRRAGAVLAVALAELWDLSLRWYLVATAVLDKEAAELLQQIPTTYRPRYAEAAKQRRAAKKAAVAGMA